MGYGVCVSCSSFRWRSESEPYGHRREEALPGVLGIQGEGLFIFRDLGKRVIYFQGHGEKLGF